MERAAYAAPERRSYAVRKSPFYVVPRIYRGVLGWWYVRWGRKLWLI